MAEPIMPLKQLKDVRGAFVFPVKVIINVTEAPTGISEQSYWKSVTVQSSQLQGTNVKWYETNSSVQPWLVQLS